MTAEEFSKQAAGAKRVTVVGPLHSAIFHAHVPTIFVDGGNQSRGTGAGLSISVGDGDSFHGQLDVTLPQEKNFSDFDFALRLVPATAERVDLLGFLGGRRDHELFALGAVHSFLKSRTQPTSVHFDAEQVVAFSAGSAKTTIHGTFSLIVFEQAELTVTGACQYTLHIPTSVAPVDSHGLSNVGYGEVQFRSSQPLFIFRI